MATAETPPEPFLALEHETNAESDEVHEPATSSVPVTVLVECEGMEGSPTYSYIWSLGIIIMRKWRKIFS